MDWSTFSKKAREQGGLAHELFVIEAYLETSMEDLAAHLKDHLAYLHDLEARGVLVMAGPLSADGGETVEGDGLVIVRAETIEQARGYAEGDPMCKHGVRGFRLRRWLMNEGRLDLKVNLSDQSVTFA